ncbi:MAG: hypothetical protein ACK559_23090 [bacterium]
MESRLVKVPSPSPPLSIKLPEPRTHCVACCPVQARAVTFALCVLSLRLDADHHNAPVRHMRSG